MAVPLKLSALSDQRVDALAAIVGHEHVSTATHDRLLYSRDMWPQTVLWTKRGHFPHPPDAVVSPGCTEEVSRLLAYCNGEGIPVIPYGGGSGVCAGILPEQGGVILNMRRMDRIVSIDSDAMIAEIETGIYGEILERQLNPRGFTMGHFPSSIYCSTLGGYLAARSAGQMSSRYGKIEDMVIGLEVVLPDGSIHRTPMAQIGTSRIDWNQIVIGSEGTLGVITRAWMKISPVPAHREYLSFHFRGVDEGLNAMRRVMQAGLEPSVLRLYDEFDTVVAATHGPGSNPDAADARPSLWTQRLGDLAEMLKKSSLNRALKRPGWLNKATGLLPPKCLLVVITEGEPDLAAFEAKRVRDICRDARGQSAGEGPARYWMEHRYAISYKQSKIFDAGAWVDTMEVATTWRDVTPLYNAVRAAVADQCFIMAHFSHAYPDGCCIYFSMTASADNPSAMEANHLKVWQTALEAVHRNRGTLTHHHGVGRSKGFMLPREFGALWPLCRQIKGALDPNGIMNPGNLGMKP